MEKIITIDLTKEIKENKPFIIGHSGENNITEIELILNEEMTKYWVFLDFKLPNGEKFKTEKLNVENNIVRYKIPKYILINEGIIIIQIVLQNDNEIIWKSNNYEGIILYSVNADEDIPDKEDFINDAQKLLNELKEYTKSDIRFVKVNNNELPIIDNAVNVNVPTKVSEIENDLNFTNKQEVDNAIQTAIIGGIGMSKKLLANTVEVVNSESGFITFKNNNGNVVNLESGKTYLLNLDMGGYVPTFIFNYPETFSGTALGSTSFCMPMGTELVFMSLSFDMDTSVAEFKALKTDGTDIGSTIVSMLTTCALYELS